MKMKSVLTFISTAILSATLFSATGLAAAHGAMVSKMVGKWKWTDYVIEVKACDSNPSGAPICATVVEGPKNKGMEMIRSKLMPKDGAFFGQVAHPATGDIYDTKMTLKDADTWSMTGCVVNNNKVCASGDFKRVK